MASILTLPKNFEDVQEATLLDEDWYELRIVKDPRIEANKVLKDFMKTRNVKDLEKALDLALAEGYLSEDDKHPGTNWVIPMRVVHEDPMINGRGFTAYVQLPNASDKDRVNISGQTIEDEKLAKIAKVLAAFHGKEVSGNEAYLESGMSARYYIIQDQDFRNPDKLSNAIDMNTDPIAA